jgi:Tfp pilus assembly protein PilE
MKIEIMKTKNILFGILALLTFASYSQTVKKNITETKSAITEFLVETDNIEELKSFDWSMVAEMFQENDENQEITLGFSYVNKSEIDKTKVRVDNFEFKVTGKTSNLKNLTSKLRRTFEKLSELDGKNKN